MATTATVSPAGGRTLLPVDSVTVICAGDPTSAGINGLMLVAAEIGVTVRFWGGLAEVLKAGSPPVVVAPSNVATTEYVPTGKVAGRAHEALSELPPGRVAVQLPTVVLP
jgi:hypothetical protein